MATINNKQPQAIFFKITSSLLKLANYSAHGGEALYACVFQGFHDNHEQKMARHFRITTSSLLKLANHAMHGSETWYACVFQHFHDNHEQKMASGTFSHIYFFTSLTCKPCGETGYTCVFQRFHDNNHLGHFY